MSGTVSIADFIDDSELLGPWFSGDSWQNWFTVLKGAFGEPLESSERDRFLEIAEREPPKTRVRELWCAIGRRGGKDSIASAIAVYFAVTNDYLPYLRPGERATIVCLACDREQAKIVFSYIRAYFEICPLLAELVHRVAADTIQLTNGVDIVVGTSSYRSLRGKSIVLAILDEVSFWREESGRTYAYASPDTEIYAALVPALATLRQAGAMIIGISTVHRKSGLLWQKWRDHHGKDGDILVIRAPSTTFNPSLNQAEIDADIALDPARGEAEWLSIWRSDLQDFVDRADVEACLVPNRRELLPVRELGPYFGFVDAAGGSGGDSYTAAVAHYDRKSGVAVLDAVREIAPKFSPEVATGQHADFLKTYKIFKVVADRYAGDWPADQFLKHGISYVPSERSKSEIYVEILPHINAHAVELLDHPKLISQFCGLERRVVRGSGREVVDHGTGRRDDVCNAAAGALLEAIEQGAHRLAITDEMIARARSYRRPKVPWRPGLH